MAASVAPGDLRPVTTADAAEILRVARAQDVGWWGEEDTDADVVELQLRQAAAAAGSLHDGGRALPADREPGEADGDGDGHGDGGGRLRGVALHVGHGETYLVVDPGGDDPEGALGALVGWLASTGATDVESPPADEARRRALADVGFRPVRSSFELVRSGPLDDLGPTRWPDGIVVAPFRPGVDEAEVHELIYSVWLDVPGHVHRPLEEWRLLFVEPSLDRPELLVLARRDDGELAGASLCTTFGDVGWVSQLAVGRPGRGVGLGRALLVESMHRLADVGANRFGLGVEAVNESALGLYRSVGLAVDREYVHHGPPDA